MKDAAPEVGTQADARQHLEGMRAVPYRETYDPETRPSAADQPGMAFLSLMMSEADALWLMRVVTEKDWLGVHEPESGLTKTVECTFHEVRIQVPGRPR